MLRIRDLTLGADEPDDVLAGRAAAVVGLAARDVERCTVVRRSLDARMRPLRWIVSVDVAFRDATEVRATLARHADHPRVGSPPEPIPAFRAAAARSHLRPLVVGMGPAGLFATLTLLEHGVTPILVDRGRAVPDRARDVARLFRHGTLDPESNVQFGEGGAGTFSDGKLYTRKRDARVRLVLERLVELGAPSRILVDGKPHIGTDRLRDVLTNARSLFRDAGVEIGFSRRVTGFALHDGRLAEVRFDDGTVAHPPATILATGHSARDVYQALDEAGVVLEAKAFAMGVRVEHPQHLVDVARYGCPRERAGAGIPPADYSLTANVAGRGVYSFCMCPGGRILAATSEAGGVVTNGMSASSRSGKRANSGLVVTIEPQDFGGDGPLAGVDLQRRWEERAFELGGGDYRAPAQRLADFVAGTATEDELHTSYRPGVRPADVAACLPPPIVEPLREAVRAFERQMPGFASHEAILVGIESRTSAPVRIVRDASGASPGAAGLFPTGEGAGFAGGIATAALDGIRAAESVLAALGLD